jgi:hypothetical protein
MGYQLWPDRLVVFGQRLKTRVEIANPGTEMCPGFESAAKGPHPPRWGTFPKGEGCVVSASHKFKFGGAAKLHPSPLGKVPQRGG